MSKKPIKDLRKKAFWLPMIQILLLLLASLCTALWKGRFAAYSMLLGGLTSIVPTLYFISRLFNRPWARQVNKILWTYYRNEVIKLVLMAGLFVITIKVFKLAFVPYALGFVIAQTAAFFAPFFYYIDAVKQEQRVK